MNEALTATVVVGVIAKYGTDIIKALLVKYANGKKWAKGPLLQAIVVVVATACVWGASYITGFGIEFEFASVLTAAFTAVGWRQVEKHAVGLK